MVLSLRLFTGLTPALLLMGSLTAQAQLHLSYGVVAGLNVLEPQRTRGELVYFNNATTNITRIYGPQAGLTAEARIGHFSFQPSVLYSQKGGESFSSLDLEYRGTQYHTISTSTLRLNYLEIPLNVVATLGPGRGLQLIAGGYVARRISGQLLDRGRSSPNPPPRPDFYPMDFDQKFDLTTTPYTVARADKGLNVGVGYRLPHWQLQAVYSRGLGTYHVPAYYNGGEWRNGAYQLKVAYLFGGKRGYKLSDLSNFLRQNFAG